MKNTEVLFLAIGGLEAGRLERTEFQGKARRASKKRFFLIAAIIALTLLLVGCAVAVYTRIHAKVTQYDIPTATVSPNEDPDTKNIFTSCYPQKLPAGYLMTGGYPIDRFRRNISYSSENGTSISFTISSNQTDNMLDPSAESTKVTVSGWEGTLQVSESGARAIFWHNEVEAYYAVLYTEDKNVDLQAMAESVAFGKPLPLSFLCNQGSVWDPWYPQQLPEGYTLSQVTFGSEALNIDYNSDEGHITYVVSPSNDLIGEVLDPPHDSCVWTEETVGGMPGRMMTTSSGLRILGWEDAQESFHALLSVPDTNVDILAMAESVAPGAPLETALEDYIGPDYSIEITQDKDTYYGWESIYPQSVPEGYTIHSVGDRAYGQQDITYENASGDSLRYTFYYRLGEWSRTFGGMGTPQEVDINGSTGFLIGSSIIWTDEAKGYGYSLSASDETLDLIAVAKSVGIGLELEPTNAPKAAKALEELGDYRITALPAGMEEDSFTGCPLEDGGGWYSYIRRWYYNKQTNQELYFTYESYVSDAASPEAVAQMYISGETPAETYTIQGCPGAGAVVGYSTKTTEVAWVQGTAEKGICFQLISPDYSVEELLQIAESIQKH